MFEDFRFIVVEDVERDREEVQNQLADAGFHPDNLLARPATYDDALEAVREHARELDVVFLDLNLPRNSSDARPEKGHGRKLLETVHNELNPRFGIRVVVVSGEDLLDGLVDEAMYSAYPGTLASIAQKSALSKTLKASLKRLRRDPLAQQIRRAKLEGVLELYECVVDDGQSTGERLKAARALGLRLLRNEVDHHLGRIDATSGYADDLNRLIKDHVESRFEPDHRDKRYINIGSISSLGGWGAFLWRGVTVQHLYTLNAYRNNHAHLTEQPYDGGPDASWTVPRDVMDYATAARASGAVAECIVRDLLAWYLPWHAQVYMPWAEGGEVQQ